MSRQLRDEFWQVLTHIRDLSLIEGRPHYPGDGLLRQAVHDDLRSTVKEWVRPRSQDLHVKGSIGAGEWAAIPWLAIMDRQITMTVSRGLYVVYLFAADGHAVYLTLNQGTGGISEARVGPEHQRMRAAILGVYKASSGISGFTPDAMPLGTLGAPGSTRAAAYEQAAILWRRYSLGDLEAGHVSEGDLEKDLAALLDFYADREVQKAYRSVQRTRIRYFMVRAGEQKEPDYDIFFRKNVVGLMWRGIGFSAHADDIDTLAQRVDQAGKIQATRPLNTSEIQAFMSIQPGDRILVPYEDTICLAFAGSDRPHDTSPEALRRHLVNQLRVDYLRDDGELVRVPKERLSKALRALIERRQSTVETLDEYQGQIDRLFGLADREAEPWAGTVSADLEKDLQNALANAAGRELVNELDARAAKGDYSAPDRLGERQVRVYGGVFRSRVLNNFRNACCVCGINQPPLLDAAHIRGWFEAPDLRLAPSNGLALCALHHRAYDRHMLQITPRGVVRVPSWVLASKNEMIQQMLARFHNRPIRKPRMPVDLKRSRSYVPP